jgi:hypothetical protein
MYYTNNPNVIEAVDIVRVLTDGTVQDLPDGTQALTVQLVIRPESGKRYAPGSFPLAMHLTDGVNYRTMAFESLPESISPSQESDADALVSTAPLVTESTASSSDSIETVAPAPALNESSTQTQ